MGGGIDGLRRGADDREPHPLALADAEDGLEVVVVDPFEFGIARQDEGVVTADGAVLARPVSPDPRLDLAVVEAGDDVQAQLDSTAHAFDDPQQLASRVGGTTTAHGEAVVELALAVVGAKRRRQHERAVDV